VVTFANCSSGLALAKLTFQLADYRLLRLTFQLAVPTTASWWKDFLIHSCYKHSRYKFVLYFTR